MDETKGTTGSGTDFIRRQIATDNESGRYGGRVVTRFPPEPNGYLHVGHAMAICLNFGIAEEFGGQCHLRYDDTNPEKESEEFARSMERDIRWLGFDWGEHLYYASDYFERMYECAEVLIEKGLAYVDSQPLEAIREGRGTVTEPGTASPYRDRSVEENLDLFRRMRGGEFEDGAHVLRGKIDLASPNMLLRDPVLYRIRHAHHYRQGDAWCIYPLYDYAHCLEDAFEDVTHSVCTLEFDNNRALYDWVLDNVGFDEPRPHQYEWAGLDLENAVLSKRAIKPLVDAGLVTGWDDPRLATIAAFRRRGVPPEALRLLSDLVGVSKSGARTEEAKLDFAVREVLNATAPRVMAVLDPLKVVVTNYPAGSGEVFDAPYFPHDVPGEGTRSVPFSRELYIERTDFSERPPKGFRRLVPGGEVRLRYAYVIRCDDVVKDADGRVTELRCSYDTASSGGAVSDGRKVKGTVQWVSASHALEAEVRLFEPLLLDSPDLPDGAPEIDITERVNPNSLIVLSGVKIEPSVAGDDPETRYQFERTGYFRRDPVDSVGDRLVFNRIVGLKSTYRDPAATTGAGDEVESDVPPARADRPPSAPPAPSVKPQISDERIAARAADPDLAARFDRYQSQLGLTSEQADLLTGTRAAGDMFEAALTVHDDAVALAGWIVTEVRGLLGDRGLTELPFGGKELGRLAGLVAGGQVSRLAAKDVLARMAEVGGDPAALVERMGLSAVTDEGALGEVIATTLAAWPDKVEEYRAGKKNLLGLFVGEVMKATRGAADPQAVRKLLTQRLDS
ncbi:MAG: glutamine--tRNA ligase/YqeY domain fusion protein [Gemmatimonadetes bacterium]|nr:glutamine--tRNA ligase/YqeY domain fusion protein [Gemmatimonadota bacterium]